MFTTSLYRNHLHCAILFNARKHAAIMCRFNQERLIFVLDLHQKVDGILDGNDRTHRRI